MGAWGVYEKLFARRDEHGNLLTPSWLPRLKLLQLDFLAVTVSYFANDFWELRHQLGSQASNIVHHVCGIAMVLAAMGFVPPSKDWLVAPFLVTEASTVFLSLAWLLQTLGSPASSPLIKGCQISFALLFFVLRAVLLPSFILVYLPTRQKELFYNSFNKAVRLCFYVVALLQWYWFSKLVRKFKPMILG